MFAKSLKGVTTFLRFQSTQSPSRDSFKALGSRKTYLVDTYVHLLRSSPVVLALHNSTLLKRDDNQLRQDIQKTGGQLTVVRSGLMRVALRGLGHADPASTEAHRLYARKTHPLSKFFKGPSAIVTLPSLEPSAVDKICAIIEKSGNKLVLLGGQVDGGALSRGQVEEFRKMPGLAELRAQLAGVLTVLGGAGLVQTLQASPQKLYLTLRQHSERDDDA